jgi:3-dehydroquinate dehydratase-1
MIVGVIASTADFRVALAMRQPPDLFELRLDCLVGSLNKPSVKIGKLRAPIIITARDPREGGANNLSLRTRRDLLLRFLPRAKYVDVELRNARAFKPVLNYARKRNVRRILSFHDFKSTPTPRALRAKAALAKKYGADIFKIACRVDEPMQLARLVDFILDGDVDLPISAMGIGKLGMPSRFLLARCGSVLNYAHLGRARVAGQPSFSEVQRWTPAHRSLGEGGLGVER